MRDLFLFFQPTQTCEPVWVCVPDVALNWFTKQKLIHTHTHIDTQTGAQTHEGCAPFARAWSMSTSTLCTYLCVYFGSGLSLGSYAVAFASWYFNLVTHGQCDMLPLPSAPRFLSLSPGAHSCPRYLFVCWHLQFIYFYFIYFTPACSTEQTTGRTFFPLIPCK